MKKLLLVLAALVGCSSPDLEVARWEARANNVTITRDDWGIAHVHGRTDADAVFGMIYAQAEDDFNRIEVNYLTQLGRLAEAEGEAAIWRDLRSRLFHDPAELQALFASSPGWLQELMVAWADGLNYFLHTHPDVEPRVLSRFVPWMALSFSEGSIGGDIERGVDLGDLRAFYDARPVAELDGVVDAGADAGTAPEPEAEPEPEPAGSNGFAIAPANTSAGHALLLINPHTSFFFRSELQMTSDEGLNAYGAVTWGQFFVYQGFNDTAGWMHTSSSVDNIDEFLETIVQRDGLPYYVYGDEERPVELRNVTIRYRGPDEEPSERTFTIYRTHHGPVIREEDGRWVAVALMENPLEALQQSFLRTKAANLEEYLETMELHTNSSNNTVFADAEGNIAYLHANFVPQRDARFDYAAPVDGSDPATDWGEPLSVDDSPNAINPPNGWVQNTNNWPYSAAGAHSPAREDFAPWVDRGSENARGLNALRLLEGRTDFTLESLRDVAYDSYLIAFEPLVPALIGAWETRSPGDSLRMATAAQTEALRGWDLRWSVESVPTTLAVYWAEEMARRVGPAARAAGMDAFAYAASRATPHEHLSALQAASTQLTWDFGTWRTPWGNVNRFQRLTGDIQQPFSDSAPSTPVGFASSRWGSLASFGARTWPGTARRYGTSGNSFVAVVEFGDRVRAMAVKVGGQSGDPDSPHFLDQAERYATGALREVYFHPDQLEGHVQERYRPGG